MTYCRITPGFRMVLDQPRHTDLGSAVTLEAAALGAWETLGDAVPVAREATGLVDAVPEGVSVRAHAPSSNTVSANTTKRTWLIG